MPHAASAAHVRREPRRAVTATDTIGVQAQPTASIKSSLMAPWVMVVLVVSAVMLARASAMTYMLWRANTMLAMMKRYWARELSYGDVGPKKREIVSLFRAAQITEPGMTIQEPAVGGFITHKASVFQNLFMRRGDVQQLVFDSFLEARGYFKDEVRRSLVPVFWPSVLARIPSDLLVYVGLGGSAGNSKAVRIAHVVGWVLETGVAVLTLVALLK